MNWTKEEYEEYLKRQKKDVKKDTVVKKKSKYGAKKTRVDGICFDSKREADYYCELKLRQRSGDILGFCRQPRFPLISDSDEQTEYVADFIVFNVDGIPDVIDIKGMETDVFKLKHKLFKAQYPKIELQIVR